MSITYSKKWSTIIRGSLFTLFSFFNKGLNFLLLIIIAKFISPDDYGSLNIFNTFIMLLGFIICFSGEGYLSVAYFQRKREDFPKYITNISIIPCLVGSTLCVINVLLHLVFPNFLGLSLSISLLAIIITFFTLYVNILLDFYRVKESITTYGIFSCSYAFFNFCLTILFIVCLQTGWYGRVYSMLICSFLYALVAVVIFSRLSLFSFKDLSLKIIQEISKWGIPLIPHASSIWLRQGCDRYIINYYYSTYEVGIFSFALNLVNIMNMIGMAFNSSNSVDIFKALSNKDVSEIYRLQAYTKKMHVIYIAVSFLISIVLIIAVPFLVPQYKASLLYFLILIPYGYLQCVYYLYCNYLYYFGHNKKLMNITFFVSLFHLFLSLIVSRYSLILTSLVYVLTQAMIVFLLKRKVSSVLKQNYNYKETWIL